MARPDLLALTDDGLIQLSNAGLVKRALREVAAWQGPQLDEAPDGTIEARFDDGTVTRLAPGRPPAAATCTCPASGLCRHRVVLVVAYRAAAPALASSDVPWDPGTLDGDGFEAGLDAAAKAELARLLDRGLTVGLERGPVPAARLPIATVRFLVPGETGYARCDCVAGGGCAHVALAIRAFRAAEGAGEVRLGDAAAGPAATDLAALVDRLLAGLLEHGVVAGPSAHGIALDQLRRAAEACGATQLLLAIVDLREQLAAYAARDARYDELEVLALVTELYARARAGDASALGTAQPYETAMAKTRLVSLGARLKTRGPAVVAAVALADTDTGATMRLEHSYAAAEGQDRMEFLTSVPRRQLAPGLTLAAIGQGQILTSVAKRRADGLLVLGQGTRGRTALMPRDAVLRLPAPLVATDVASLARRLAERPPAMLRQRDRLGTVHIFAVDAVLGQVWSPGNQSWQAAVELVGEGGTLHLARTYDRAAPKALDTLAAALDGRFGAVRQIAGPVWVEGGGVLCDPWSVAADQFVVPDLAKMDESVMPGLPTPLALERSPVEDAQALLAGALHAGRPTFAAAAVTAGPQATARLHTTGHTTTARRLSAWLGVREDHAAQFGVAAVWVAAMIEDAGLHHDEVNI